jgi:hypothetical protein
MSRKRYTCFTLVNPIISSWQHDTMDNNSSDPVQNTMQVQYETVWYARGGVKEGTAPKSFGPASGHYDKTPSPNSLAGGGTTSLFGQGGVAAGASDVFGDITSGQAFSSPTAFLGTVLKAGSLSGNIKNLTKEGLKQEGFGILKDQLGRVSGGDISGVANTAFPKSVSASGFANNITNAVAGISAGKSIASSIKGGSLTSLTNFMDNNAGALDSLTKSTTFKKAHLAGGGTPTPDAINTAWNNISTSAKNTYNSLTRSNLNTHKNDIVT